MSDTTQTTGTRADQDLTLNSPSAALNPEDNKSDATPWIIFVVGCIASFFIASGLLNLTSSVIAWTATAVDDYMSSGYYEYSPTHEYMDSYLEDNDVWSDVD